MFAQQPDGKSLLKVDLASVYKIGEAIPYHGTERFAHPHILDKLVKSRASSSSSSSSSGSGSSASIAPIVSPISLPVLIAPQFAHSLHSLTATCVFWCGLTDARRRAVKAAGRDCAHIQTAWAAICSEDSNVKKAFELAWAEQHEELLVHLTNMHPDGSS